MQCHLDLRCCQLVQFRTTAGLKMTTRPNFFIVGAPKCGTSAMDSYLKVHPDIFMPACKELTFFGSDFNFADRMGLDEYLGHFQAAGDRRRIGEASPWYLYSERAAAEIKDFAPGASIIIMLRNPADFLYSLHGQMLYTSKDDIADFSEALAAETDRKLGTRLPRVANERRVTNFDVRILFYREIAKFSVQVKRYFLAFGRDRVHVIIHDDFKRNTAAVYRRVLEFLEVDPDFQPEFPEVNVNKKVRNHRLQRVLRYPPTPIVTAVRAIFPHTKLRTAIKSHLFRLNAAPQQRPPLDRVLRSQLLKEFQPEIERLGGMVGRDLSSWCAA